MSCSLMKIEPKDVTGKTYRSKLQKTSRFVSQESCLCAAPQSEKARSSYFIDLSVQSLPICDMAQVSEHK